MAYQRNKPCPRCGGADRFYYVAAPRNGGSPFWQCRQCRHTDRTDGSTAEQRTPPAPPLADAERHAVYAAYTEVATYCHQLLYTPPGRAALAYLHGRGLNDDTISELQLGYCPPWRDRLPKDPLDPTSHLWRTSADLWRGAHLGGFVTGSENRPTPVLDGPRIVLPYWRGETCVMLRSRALNPRQAPRYTAPSCAYYAGDAPSFFNHAALTTPGPVLLTEGEIKAAAVLQAYRAGRYPYNCVATPGAGYFPAALAAQLAGRRVYLALDPDDAGRKQATAAAALLRRYSAPAFVIELPTVNGRKVDLDELLKEAHL